MVVIFLVLLMVNAVFGVVIAGAFVNTPSAVFPAWSAIFVALIIGQLVHRKFNLMALSIGGVIALYLSVYAGSVIPLELPDTMFGLTANANWIVILFIYAAIASMLPVWVLLQPRDFINGMQLFVGLILLYGAVLLSLPDISAPAFNQQMPADAPPLVPLLFVTIACGAVSGFHGIVSSGTSSKQLNKETDARFVGYLGAVGEGSLALITLVAVSSVALAASPEIWHEIYDQYGTAGAGTFIQGGAQMITNGWGLPFGIAQTLLATMVVLFAGTTMDSGVRLQRYIIQEWGEIYNIPLFKKGVLATLGRGHLLPVTGIRCRRRFRQRWPDYLAAVRLDQPDTRRADLTRDFGDAHQIRPAGALHDGADDLRVSYVFLGSPDQVAGVLRGG
jgi:carbon starvation protein